LPPPSPGTNFGGKVFKKSQKSAANHGLKKSKKGSHPELSPKRMGGPKKLKEKPFKER